MTALKDNQILWVKKKKEKKEIIAYSESLPVSYILITAHIRKELGTDIERIDILKDLFDSIYTQSPIPTKLHLKQNQALLTDAGGELDHVYYLFAVWRPFTRVRFQHGMSKGTKHLHIIEM